MIKQLNARWKGWQERRFLKKHGCETREQYERKYDTNFCYRNHEVRRKYHGYKFVHCFSRHTDYAYKIVYDYGPGGYRDGYHDIHDWCKEQCENKFRVDVLRVIWNQWVDDWVENEIGGADYVFFAFKNETDYMNFLLRWAGVSR